MFNKIPVKVIEMSLASSLTVLLIVNIMLLNTPDSSDAAAIRVARAKKRSTSAFPELNSAFGNTNVARDKWMHKLSMYSGRMPAKQRINFWARAQEVAVAAAVDEARGALGGGVAATESTKKKSKGANVTHKELTVSIPRFVQNERGDWVATFWGITFGKVFHDTRFGMGHRYTPLRYILEKKMVSDYYPTFTGLDTVCVGRSTVYNVPRIADYLQKKIYYNTHQHRPIWTDLRQQIYEQGNSEECHSRDMLRWQDYMDCAVRRNQRLEYLIPKYPLHQMGHNKDIFVLRRA